MNRRAPPDVVARMPPKPDPTWADARDVETDLVRESRRRAREREQGRRR